MAARRFAFFNVDGSGFAYYDTASTTADETTLGKITLGGIGGIALDASSQRIIGVGTPTTGTDAANKTYVDSIAQGVDWKGSVRAATTGNHAATRASNTLTASANAALVIDGVSVAIADRVLMKDQTTGADNGIYTVTQVGSVGTPFILERATDADVSAEVTAGLSVFVEEGTANADTGWILTTNQAITLNTTALVFTQFTGLGTVTAGLGLTKTGNTLDVGKGDGIIIAADTVSIDLDTNPGLSLVGSTPNKKLGFLPDTARGLNKDATGSYVQITATTPGIEFVAGALQTKLNTNGGLEHNASGDQVKVVSVDRLSIAAAGLDVTGVPSLFKINAVAVGATVTSANLGTVTNGGNADTLHVHTFTGTTSAQGVRFTRTANGAIAAFTGVYYNGNDTVSQGDSTVVSKVGIIGVALAAITGASSGTIVQSGVITGAISGATAGTPYYMSAGGLPVVAGSIAAGARVILLGFAKNATDLEVVIQDIGMKPT